MTHKTNGQTLSLANSHVSVDCVVLAFDGQKTYVLLMHRKGMEAGVEFNDMKLPGSVIFLDEELDDAAKRVLSELTGLRGVRLMQFQAFGTKDRTKNPKDVHWLEKVQKVKVERIITIAYIGLVKLTPAMVRTPARHDAEWVSIDAVPPLAFDHNRIITEGIAHFRAMASVNPVLCFELLQKKFTAKQLNTIYNFVHDKPVDVRNFHKKMASMEYVIPLDEWEDGVAHRAARFYRFDRAIYNKNAF